MATPNFAAPENASNYFAICMSYERPVLDDDGEETEEMESVQPDSWEVEDTISNLKFELEAATKETDYFFNSEHNLKDYSNSYNKTALGEIYISKMYGDVEIYIMAIPLIQSAYYEGANLDYIFKFQSYNDTFDDFDDYFEDLFDFESDMPKGMQVIQERNACAWAKNTMLEMSEIIEKIFKESAEYELVKTCQFSNGEAIYGLADNKRNELKSKLLNA